MDNEENVTEDTGAEQEEEMCCKGDGTTAAQHRHDEGKCCIDE
jgi:hypothetical protein